MGKIITGLKNGKLDEIDDDDVDYDLPDTDSLFSSNINLIPMPNAVQAPRSFYGARFFNQALPMVHREAPLVQNLKTGSNESYDEMLGEFAGATRASEDGEVIEVNNNKVVVKGASGTNHTHDLYSTFPFNRKSSVTQAPAVQIGAQVKRGDRLAVSNYTDDKGTLAMGVNARIGLVPYKGWSMDDATVISESFAKKLTSEMTHSKQQEFDDDVKGGHKHFVSLFPTVYTTNQLKNLDDNGVARVGTILKTGDPMILATAPRIMTSRDANVGKLSRTLQQTRKDSSQTWDYEDDGIVMDVAHTPKGSKVVIKTNSPGKVGDKIVLRTGQKQIISKILPDERMLRGVDGKPMDMLLNQMGLPSRVNTSLPFELALGKIARKTGVPIKLGAFNEAGTSRRDLVKDLLKQHDVTLEEEVFDPETNRKLRNPVSVGDGFVMKLLHVGESKKSARGVASYDSDMQPARGGGEGAQSKRVSGLEQSAFLSAGAYATQEENSTLRGTRSDEYWRQLRAGETPAKPGEPFVWQKFQALLQGAGMHARKMGKGRMRLGPMTDSLLAEQNPVELKNGEIVDLNNLEPVSGGLFDPAMVGGNKWGKISLPKPLPNPSFEKSIRTLMGFTQNEFNGVLNGTMHIGQDGKVFTPRPEPTSG